MTEKKSIFNSLASDIPLDKGDAVLIASDIVRLCCELNKEETIEVLNYFIDLLKQKVGEEGTLLFPTYNWAFCRGIAFDYKKTRSKTGALSQIALNRKDFVRTKHALYSFAVWGKDAKKLYDMNDSNSFMGDTPFNYLYQNNGKMIMIDVLPTHCFTFAHYVEEICGVNYRFRKEFHGDYIDENRTVSKRMYSMLVRYLDERSVDTNPEFDRWLKEINILGEIQSRGIPIRYINFKDAFKCIEYDIKNECSKHIIVSNDIRK